MNTNQAIHKIIQVAQGTNNTMFGNMGGPSWMGQSSGLQPQVNSAIAAWTEKGTAEDLLGIIEILCTTGLITDTEADELSAAFNK